MKTLVILLDYVGAIGLPCGDPRDRSMLPLETMGDAAGCRNQSDPYSKSPVLRS